MIARELGRLKMLEEFWDLVRVASKRLTGSLKAKQQTTNMFEEITLDCAHVPDVSAQSLTVMAENLQHLKDKACVVYFRGTQIGKDFNSFEVI